MPDLYPVCSVQTFPLASTNQEAGLFGFKIPFLPDFLSDHTLLGEPLEERMDEIFQRLTRLVTGVRKYRGSAYALRLMSSPENGMVDLYLLGRVLTEPGHTARGVRQLTTGLSAHLNSYHIPHIPLNAKEPGLPPLGMIIQPFSGSPAVVELRQHEQLVPLMAASTGANRNEEGYTLHPYWGPFGSFLEPFETMLRLPAPSVVNIYLEPTELTKEEVRSFSEAAAIAQTLADVDLQVFSDVGIHRRRDPGADLIARIYSTYIKSLTEPFLLAVQVASPDPDTAWTVARSLASSIAGPSQIKNLQDDERGLPGAADINAPATGDEYQKALWTLHNLLWYPRAGLLASPDKQRMPYLVGAKGAASAFRFPISVKGGVPGVEVRQLPPDFEPGPRPKTAGPGELLLGQFRRGGAVTVPVKDFTRHALITGFTGSGKTNTVLFLLSQLWRTQRIPFLVIESAKKEYRALSRVPGFEDLLVFTFGDETTSPFRLNPFELLPEVRLESHISKLQACFDAAMPQFGILPSIVAEALELVYQNKGWKLTDMRKMPDEERLFPTMRDMLAEVIRVTESRGYAGETYHNIRAAAAGRIGSLLRGSRGCTFGSQRSYPAETIFTRPVILELDDLNEDEKALVMMFLLTWLREYRQTQRARALQHVTVVEEAHNVLSSVQSVGASEVAADTKAKAVGAFSNMLAEVRAYGEGLVISDQSPEKLAPDAMRNTNIQIAHQLRDRRDREAIARAMIMDEQQQEYLGKLRVGEAAFFRTGIEKATFITVPEFKDSSGFDDIPDDAFIRQRMETFRKQYQTAALPFDGCRFCKSACAYRELIEPQTMDKEIHEQFVQALDGFNQHPEPEHWAQNWLEVVKACVRASRAAKHGRSVDAAFCYLAHEIDFPFTPHMRVEFEKAFASMKG